MTYVPPTAEDKALQAKWDFDPRYTNDLSDMWRSERQLPQDMGSVAKNVIGRINQAHDDGAELDRTDPGLICGTAYRVY